MSRIDPSVAGRIPRATLRAEIAKLVSEIATEQRVELNEAQESLLAAELTDEMTGLGPLEPFLEDDEVTEIFANGPFDVYVERCSSRPPGFATASRGCPAQEPVLGPRQARTRGAGPTVPRQHRVAAAGAQRRTISFGFQKCLTLVMCAGCRCHKSGHDALQIAARDRLNILISGVPGSGKTTLLNAISQYIDRDERVITIEDVVELRLQQPHVVQMETRPPNVEGVGHISKSDLLRDALRCRPTASSSAKRLTAKLSTCCR